jgi:hypothetical protein
VVQAEPGARFGFDTESTLERKHARTWHARFASRYEIQSSEEGAVISFTSEVRPQNYIPWWLKPGMRAMTRALVQRMTRAHMENLAQMAQAGQQRQA